MSNVVKFLELVGRDSSLRYAESSVIGTLLSDTNIDASLWPAVVQGKTRELETALGIAPNVCAVIFPVDSDERAHDSDN